MPTDDPTLPLAVVDGEVRLVCPVCGEWWTHILQTDVAARPEDRDGTAVTIRNSGENITVRPGAGADILDPTGSRRDRVVLQVSGECGHGWSLAFIQHKGITQVKIVSAF